MQAITQTRDGYLWIGTRDGLVDKLLLTTDSAFTLAPNTILGPSESVRGDGTPQARVTITQAGGNVSITWNVPPGLSRLHQANEVTGQWTDLAGADPTGYTVAANAARRFYRVAVP